MKISKRTIILTMIILLLLSLTGCGRENKEKKTVFQEDEVYTIADSTGDWGFPAPYTHYNRGPGYVRMSLIFDTLIWKDKTGSFVGALAQKWEYVEDDTAFVFQLRKDVKWHDGESFTAADVLFTLDYLKEHPYSWSDISLIDRAEALDSHTVKVYLKKAYAPLLANVAGTLPILPRHIYKNINSPLEYTESDALVGTGPFKLVDYNKEHGTYLYAANEDYYLGQPRINKLQFIKIGEQMIPNAVLDGTANTGSIPPELVEQFKAKGLTVLVSDHSWNAKLKFNLQEEPFANKKFRQALAYGIDRKKLVNISQRGHAVIGSPGFIPPDNPWYSSEIEQYDYNPEKARKLLEELGYVLEREFLEKGSKPFTVEILTSGRFSGDAELVKNDLDKLGIKTTVRSMDGKTVDARTTEWSFQLVISGHGGLGGDPAFFNTNVLADTFHSARYKDNQELLSLLNQQLETIDENKRRELLAEIQKIYAIDIPALSLYYPTTYEAMDSKVDLYYTPGGLASGIPIALNKLSFLQ